MEINSSAENGPVIEQLPPSSKGRRFVTASLFLATGIIVALIIMASRADSRFIGEWRVVEGANAGSGNILSLGAYGTGILFDSSRNPCLRFHWWIEGESLVIQSPGNELLATVKESLNEAYARSTNQLIVGSFKQFRIRDVFAIQSIDRSAIQLKAASPSGLFDGNFTLQRH